MDTQTQTQSDVYRCFHCDELFTTRESAAEHFGSGNYESEIPLCVEAATTDQRALILTNRELWEQVQSARSENEDLEGQVHSFEYFARKLTGKPSATVHDLEHEWDFMQGRVIAAEAAINAAPKWLASILRQRAERLYLKRKRKQRQPVNLLNCEQL